MRELGINKQILSQINNQKEGEGLSDDVLNAVNQGVQPLGSQAEAPIVDRDDIGGTSIADTRLDDVNELSFMEGYNEDEKDLIKTLIRSEEHTPDEIQEAVLTVGGEHPDQEGFQTWYTSPESGLPVPLKPGQKPPKGINQASVWGSQESADEAGIMTDIGKNLANTVPQFMGSIGDVGATLQTLVTGEEPQWYKNQQTRLKALEGATSDASKGAILDTEGMDAYSDILDSERWDFNARNVAGSLSQAASSIIQFMGANVLTGGLGTTVKGAQAAGMIAKAGVKGGKALATTTKALKGAKMAQRTKQLTASTMINMGEPLAMAEEAGLQGREKFMFSTLVGTAMAAVEMNLGITSKLLGNTAAQTERKFISGEVLKHAKRGADGKFTKESIAAMHKEAMELSALYGKKWATQLAKSGGEEASEEMIQTAIQNGGAQVYDKLFGGEVVGEGKFGKEMLSPESLGETINAGIIGFMAGSGMKAPGTIKESVEKQSSMTFDAVKAGPKGVASLIAELSRENQQGALSDDDLAVAKEKINLFEKYNDQVSDLDLNDSDKKEIFDLTYSNENLNTQIEQLSKDPESKIKGTIPYSRLKDTEQALNKNVKRASEITSPKIEDQQTAVAQEEEIDESVPAEEVKKDADSEVVRINKEREESHAQVESIGIKGSGHKTVEEAHVYVDKLYGEKLDAYKKKKAAPAPKKKKKSLFVSEDATEEVGSVAKDAVAEPVTLYESKEEEDSLGELSKTAKVKDNLNESFQYKVSDTEWVFGKIKNEDGIAVFDSGETQYELGGYEGIQDKVLSDLDLVLAPQVKAEDRQASDVDLSLDGETVSVRGKEYKNLHSDKLQAINRDSDGNIVSVTLDDSNGKKKTFRGNSGQEVAYNILLQDVSGEIGEDQEDEINEIIKDVKNEESKPKKRIKQKGIVSETEARELTDKSKIEGVEQDKEIKRLDDLEVEMYLEIDELNDRDNGTSSLPRKVLARKVNEIKEKYARLARKEDVVSKAEFDEFVDKGIVTPGRIQDLAEKVKNKKELSVRERSIFDEKAGEVNEILKTEKKKDEAKEELPKPETATVESADTEVATESTPTSEDDKPNTAEAKVDKIDARLSEIKDKKDSLVERMKATKLSAKKKKGAGSGLQLQALDDYVALMGMYAKMGLLTLEEVILQYRIDFADDDVTDNQLKNLYNATIGKKKADKVEDETLKKDDSDVNAKAENSQFFGDKKFEQIKDKVRKSYTNIKGFENDDEIETVLTKLARNRKSPFEKDYKASIKKLAAHDTEKTRNLAERLDTLTHQELVRLFNIFRSTNYNAYIRHVNQESNKLTIANSAYQESLLRKIEGTLDKYTEKEFKDERKQFSGATSKDQLFFFINKFTGLTNEQLDKFINAKTFKGNKGLALRILKNMTVSGTDKAITDKNGNVTLPFSVSTKEAFFKKFAQDLSGRGGILNTIAENTPVKQLLKEETTTKHKDSDWNNKSSGEFNTHLTNMMDKLADVEYKVEENSWATSQRKGSIAPTLVYYDGVSDKNTLKKATAGNIASQDIRNILSAKFESDEMGPNSYLQNVGQFGDKKDLVLIEAKRYKTLEEAEAKYKDMHIARGKSQAEVNKMYDNLIEESDSLLKSLDEDMSKLFAINYAINFREINEFINGNYTQYEKGGNPAYIDIFKRSGSTKSPGIVLDKYIKGGVGFDHRLAVINAPKAAKGKIDKEKEFNYADGQEFITRAWSDKVNMSSGGMFETILKAITSYTLPGGKRFLVKTNAIVIDDLVKAFPNNEAYAAIQKLMVENELDRVVTKDGAKYQGETKPIDFFDEGTSNVKNYKFDDATHLNTIDNDFYLVQQDLRGTGVLSEGSTPIQRIKNMLVSSLASTTTKAYNEIGKDQLKDILGEIININEDELRKYILKELKKGLTDVPTTKDEMSEEEKVQISRQEHISELLEAGVPLDHPQLSKFIQTFVSNVITKDALMRITNKALFVEGAYLPSSDFKLRDMREVDGNMLMPEVAVSAASGLRLPQTFDTFKEAQDAARGYEDMTDYKGRLRVHEIEPKNGKFIVPGEYVMVTRIPADDLHSHTLARVAYHLPASMGNVVISNPQSQYISGSDFDGDQRTVEGLFKNSKGKHVTNTSSRWGLANQAFKNYVEYYYDSRNHAYITSPIDTGMFKTQLANLPDQKKRLDDSIETFVQSRLNNNVGLNVVGIMANLQSVYDYLKKHNSKLKNMFSLPVLTMKDGVTTFVEEKDLQEFSKNSDIKTVIGNLENLALDNVKDPKIERLGLNEVTANMYVGALMLDMNIDSVVALFNHPTAKDYVDRIRKTKDTGNKVDEFEVFERMAKKITKVKDAKELREILKDDAPIDQKEINNPESIAVLLKLKQLSDIGLSFNKVHSVIRGTETSPKTWADYKSLSRVFNQVSGNAIGPVDVSEFNGSEFIEMASESIEVSKQFFKDRAFEETNSGKKVLGDLLDKVSAKKPTKQQLTDYSTALNRVALNTSRGRKTPFAAWSKVFIQELKDRKTAGLYPVLTNALEIKEKTYKDVLHNEEGKYETVPTKAPQVAIRQDLKKAITNRELKAVKADILKLRESTNTKDKSFYRNLIDYAAFEFGLADSKFGGSYASLFPVEVHKEVGEDLKKTRSFWEASNNDRVNKVVKSIQEANPSLNPKYKKKTYSQKKNIKERKIYEPFIGPQKAEPISKPQVKKVVANLKESGEIVNGYKGDITPEKNTVFVFGSNPEGRHGAGAAKIAKDKFGAIYGNGEGIQGQSYALPTKDLRIKKDKGFKSISSEDIIKSIDRLYEVARKNPEKKFKVAYRNTSVKSLNGYTGNEMMDMFVRAEPIPDNIIFSAEWMNTGAFAFSREDKPQQQKKVVVKPKKEEFTPEEIDEALKQREEGAREDAFKAKEIGSAAEQKIVNGGGFTTTSVSYKTYGNPKNVKDNKAMTLKYLRVNAKGLDQHAKELGVSIDDLVDFMEKFPSGIGKENSTSPKTFYGYYNPNTGVQGTLFQKKSIAPSSDISKVIKRLQRAIPNAKVVYDSTIKGAGQLDADGKTIRIRPGYAGTDTPIHEYGHIIIDAIGGTSSALVKRGIEQLKNTDLWIEIEARYPELNADELGKEALAEAIGREGVGIFKSKAKQNSFVSWLSGLFFKIKSKLGISKNVAKDLAKQLLRGEDLGITPKPTGKTQEQKESDSQSVNDDLNRESFVDPVTGEVLFDQKFKTPQQRRDTVADKLEANSEKDWESYAEATAKLSGGHFTSESNKDKIDELKDKILALIKEDKKKYFADIKAYENEIKRLEQKAKEYQKAFLKYEKDIEEVSKLIRATDPKGMDIHDLISLYERLKSLDVLAAKSLTGDTLERMADTIGKTRVDEIVKENPGLFTREIDSGGDIKPKDVWFKAMSDFSHKYPKMQALGKVFKDKAGLLTAEKGVVLNNIVKAEQAVIDEYNKKHGVKAIAKRFFNPSSDNSDYYSFMVAKKGKLVVKGDEHTGEIYKNLTKAQKDFSDIYVKVRDRYSGLNKTVFGSNGVIKVEKTFRETYKSGKKRDSSHGVLDAYIDYASSVTKVMDNVRMNFDDGNTIKHLTFSEIKENIKEKGEKGLWSKVKAIYELSKYKRKALALIKEKRHEGQPKGSYEVDGMQEFSIDKGKIKTKFDKTFGHGKPYSGDHGRALREYAEDMIFVKHMNKVVPYVESVEHFLNNSDEHPHLKKYLDIWKKGNITKEVIEGPFGSTADEVISFFRKWTHMKIMAFNVPAAVFNVLIGKYNNWRGLTSKYNNKGRKRFFEEFKKTKAFNEHFHAVSVTDEIEPIGELKTAGGIFNLLAYGATRLGEVYIQLPAVVGQFSDKHWSWIGEDGQIKEEGLSDEEVRNRKEIIAAEATKYKKNVEDIQGKYSEFEKRNFSHFELGRAFGQFRVWMPDVIRDRFAAKYIDLNGNVRQGTLNYIGSKMSRDGAKDLIAELKRVGMGVFKEETDEHVLIVRNLKSFMAVSAVYLGYLAFSDDDDDKDAANKLYKAFQDMSFIFNVDQIANTAKTPAASLATLTDAIKVITSIGSWEKYKNDGEYHSQGDLKAYKKGIRSLPYHKLAEIFN